MSTVRLNKASIAALADRQGPVGKHVIKKGTELLALAKSHCPVGKSEGGGEHKHLRDALELRINERSVVVGVLHDEELKKRMKYVQEGTGPHPIDAVNAQVLHFQIAGVDIYTMHVDHPGTVANPFLTLAAMDLGLIVKRYADSEF